MPDAQTLKIGPADAPDRYELIERQAAGGEGEVWKAREYHGGEPFLYAVKIIKVDGAEASRRLEDLRMQAALAIQLEHAALVKVKEVFLAPPPGAPPPRPPPDDDGVVPAGAEAAGQRLYFVMKWIEGRSLQDALERREVRGLDVLPWLESIADALDYLHSGRDTNGATVLHRDIKPANILIANDTRVYLVDFGLVRLRSTDATSRVFGTAPFMAPESLTRGEFTPATDRYALGATVYYALTGEMPALGNPDEMTARLTAVLGPGHDRVVRGVLAMLAGAPDRRPPSAAAWIRALRNAPPETSQVLPTAIGPAPGSPVVAPGSPVVAPGSPVAPPPTSVPHRPIGPPPSGPMGYPTPTYPQGPSPSSGPPYGGPPMSPLYPAPPSGYPPPPSPHLSPAASGYHPGRPGAAPRRKSRVGLIIGLTGALALVLLVACCWRPFLDALNEANNATNGGTPAAGRSIDRSIPAPAVTVLEPVLLAPADITAAMKVPLGDVQAASNNARYLKGGLNRLALCSERPIPDDIIGSHTSNSYQVHINDPTDIDTDQMLASAVAGFFGNYATEYLAAVRTQAQRCGWTQFTMSTIGAESLGLFHPQGSDRGLVAMVFVRSGQVVFQIGYDAYKRGNYQVELFNMALAMSKRVPPGAGG